METNGRGFAETQVGKGEPKTSEEQLKTAVPETPALVRVEYGMTINLGNFESARVTAGITMPCDPKDVDSIYEFCSHWVEERIDKEVKDIKAAK